MKMQLNMFIYFILCPFTESDFLMLFRLIVADLFFFSKIKWKSDLNSPEGFWASSASDCSLTIVLCAHLPSTCMPGMSCIFYKTAFVQESLIRSLVTCWGFSLMRWCAVSEERERGSFSHTHLPFFPTLHMHKDTNLRTLILRLDSILHKYKQQCTNIRSHTTTNTHIGGSQPPAGFNSPPESSLSMS